MKNFCRDLKEHATKIIDCKWNEYEFLNDEEIQLYREQNVCYICKKEFSTDDIYEKKI